LAKVDAFHAQVVRRRGEDLACRLGCDACCQVRLSVSAVEAAAVERELDGGGDALRARLAARLSEAPERDNPPRCIMLEDDGSCAVYEARPMVCRTQGMALRYPPRTFPEDAVMARDGEGSDIVWCPLNFRHAPPEGQDVLEAGRLDEMLALVNLDWTRGDREAAIERTPLEDIAARWVAREK